jgi:hypothetical protein
MAFDFLLLIFKTAHPELSFCLAVFQSKENNQRHQHHFLDIYGGHYGGHCRADPGAECFQWF